MKMLSFLLPRLAKDRHSRSHRLWTRLLRDEEGAWLISATMMLPVLIGVAGLGTEGGMLFYQHRSLQSAADAAAFSAAYTASYSTNNSSANITSQAQATVASYGFTVTTTPGQVNQAYVTATTINNYLSTSLTAVQVTISRPQSAIFSSILFSVLPNSVSAIAVIGFTGSGSPQGTCLLAFGNQSVNGVATPDAPNAIHVQGNSNMNMGGCGVTSNSTAPCSNAGVTIQGNGSLLAGSFSTAGCATGNGNHPPQIGPPPNVVTEFGAPLSDPYAGTSVPTTSSAGSCVASLTVYCPGVYASGLTLIGGPYTLSPGIYIMEGEFRVGPGGGGTTVNGNGVTLVFTSATPSNPSSYPSTMLDFDSNANVTLTAPTTGATAGFVIMGDRTMPLGTTFTTVANSTVNLNGTLYLPNGFVNWQGTANTTLGCRQFLVNTISLQGNPQLNSNGCSPSGGGNSGAGGAFGAIVSLVD
jgi:Flp pilus assembly protein TadG